MANKEYYERWLKIKEHLGQALTEDERLQELAVNQIGIKPQGTAVEVVARVFCKYCELYNKLCDCYDQMEQVQRRPYIKKIIDALTCRILELKTTLEEVEAFEYTYPMNALQQMIMIPSDIQVMCPFFYPFEIRIAEMQYIVDQILEVGNRLGDPEPTPSELERKEEERLEQERIKQEEKDAEIKRKLAMGEDIIESVQEEILSPEEQEEIRKRLEYECHINNIQRMERSRVTTRAVVHKANKDLDMYLELAGIKKPPARDALRIRAAKFIQMACRKFMQLKRDQDREYKLRLKLGMIIPASSPVSAKVKLEEVRAQRRNFRRRYYEKFMQENLKENARVLRLREGNIMEDISDEIRQWFDEWFREVKVFDEFPWPDEGGSILIVRGETFSIEEYIEWQIAEEKRLKAEASAPKSKDQIKAEKIAAREEKKRLDLEAKIREKKRLLDYKKSRLNPDNDPGVYIKIGQLINPLTESWAQYQSQWKAFDTTDAQLDVIRGFIKLLITETAYQDIHLKLRPIVDEMMRIELNLLKNALKTDYDEIGTKIPITKKRKKPKKPKQPRPDKIKPEVMFQALVDQGIVIKYPKRTLDDYWGDLNYAAADMRAVLWTPSFPPPCMGDVREQVRTRCLLTLGCECPNAVRAQLLVGPKGAGKRTLVYAIATETNSILIDLSPLNVYNKFPGPKNLKTMFTYVTKISKLMQPTVILVDDADKMFYKKVPKEEKMFDPTRLSKDFFKEVLKPIQIKDKILILGTASEPWMAKTPQMYKVFPSTILIPRSDYGSISYVLTKVLMQYHGVKRDFNVHSIAQVLRGYDINSIRKGIAKLMNGNRVAALYHKPLDPREILGSVLNNESTSYTAPEDFEMFQAWYDSYSPFGEKRIDLMLMLESQLKYKLKAEKKSP